MAVGFQFWYYWYKVGMGDFLYSFFSTICYNLENGQWGSIYPYVMKELYSEKLKWQNIKFARDELKEIQGRLKEILPDKVVWNFEDLSACPPWGDNISNEITDLSNYFITSDGRNLISLLFEVFDEAERREEDIEIVSV